MADTRTLSDRQRALQRPLAHYNGTPAAPLKPRANAPDDNLIISLARLIVDKGASFLFGQTVETQVDAGSKAVSEQQQQWLEACWKRNKRGITLLKAATNGGIFGHCFLRLLDTKPFPRVIVLDPQIVTVKTDPDDVDTVWKVTITPPLPDPDDDDDDEPEQTRTVIANPSGQAGYRVMLEDDTEPWTITDQVFRGGTWLDLQQAPWPYPFCPIAHCQNLPKPNDFWGESDLPEDILKILDGINRIASHYNKIIRIHAHPKFWTSGMGKANLDFSIDAVIKLPSETAQLRTVEMQSDLSSTKALLDELLELLSWMVRIPVVALGKPDSAGALSGVALQIRYQPLVEKTESKRLTYGDMLAELDRRLLTMQGFPDPAPTELSWPELLPSDPLMERQVMVLDDSLGLASRETLSTKAGYDWETEQKRLTEEKAQAVEEAQAAMPSQVPTNGQVPPPQALQAPIPDIARNSRSR